MVAERDGLAVLGGLGDVGVGVDQVVGAGVLGEEGEHRAGPLGPGGHVVLFQDRIVTPVHDGMEVQVEDRLLAGRQARGDHLLVEGGEEALLVVVAQPVGVVGERGLLRQHRQAGEQGAGRVGEQVVDVGDPPGGGELEGEQGQDPADRRDGRGARVAGPGDQRRQVEGDQVGDGQQQPGQAGLGAGGERTEVDDARGGQAGVAAGGGRAGAGLGRGTAQQPAEALLREDLPRGSARRRCGSGRFPPRPAGR